MFVFSVSFTILTYDIYFSSRSTIVCGELVRRPTYFNKRCIDANRFAVTGGWGEREGGVVVERSDNRNQCTAESDQCAIFLSPRVVRLLHSLPWRTRKKMTTPRLSHPQRHTSHARLCLASVVELNTLCSNDRFLATYKSPPIR